MCMLVKVQQTCTTRRTGETLKRTCNIDILGGHWDILGRCGGLMNKSGFTPHMLVVLPLLPCFLCVFAPHDILACCASSPSPSSPSKMSSPGLWGSPRAQEEEERRANHFGQFWSCPRIARDVGTGQRDSTPNWGQGFGFSGFTF